MNKKLAYIFPLILFALGAFFMLQGKKHSISTEEGHQHDSRTLSRSSGKVGNSSKLVVTEKKSFLVKEDQRGQVQQIELSKEQESLVRLTKIFERFAGTQRNENEFVKELVSLGLKPIVARDRQDLIEDLTIIRPENTLPGVRYIHGQFDGDETQELQHVSFEIKKGPRAFEQGMNLVRESMGLGERLKDTDPKMAIFKMDGYVVWLKEMTWEDMMHDPFNAYTKADVGNIRVAIERDIHDHMDHGS